MVTALARFFSPSSSSARSTRRAVDSTERTMPAPPQCGQVTVEPATTPARRRWRDISSRPNWRDLADLDPGAVILHRIAQALFHLAVVAAFFHVDEVDHDQPGQVAQAQLAANFVGGFQIGLARGFLDGMFAGGAAGIDVDRDQRLGLVDHDIAARFQRDGGREHGVQLGFDMHALEQRHRVLVLMHIARMARHQHAHEVLGVAVALLRLPPPRPGHPCCRDRGSRA